MLSRLRKLFERFRYRKDSAGVRQLRQYGSFRNVPEPVPAPAVPQVKRQPSRRRSSRHHVGVRRLARPPSLETIIEE